MKRYVVTRQWIKHKGKMYYVGDILPIEFSERDIFRNIYSSRIGVTDIPDNEIVSGDIEIPGVPVIPQGVVEPAVPIAPTGTQTPPEKAKAVPSTVKPNVATAAKSISGQAK